MSAAYSVMVRSLENLPELATFRMALRAHSSESAYSVTSRRSASRYEVNVGQVHVVVAPGQEHVAQRGEHTRLVAAEVIREEAPPRHSCCASPRWRGWPCERVCSLPLRSGSCVPRGPRRRGS